MLSTKVLARRVPHGKFTRLLLVGCASRFPSSPAFLRSPQRWLLRRGFRFEFSPAPLSSSCAGSGTASETNPGSSTADAPFRLLPPGPGNAAIVLRLARQEIPWERQPRAATWHSLSAQTRRRQEQSPGPHHFVTLPVALVGPSGELALSAVLP